LAEKHVSSPVETTPLSPSLKVVEASGVHPAPFQVAVFE
jgi:hypothetical protein